jgi:hypothetical protein
MAKKYFERRSLATALLTYLQTEGYNITEIREGYESIEEIKPPLVVVTFMPSRFRELQMGRDKPMYLRRVQIDCYMESESRAEAITDDIGDFVDEDVITVVTNIGSTKAYMRSITDTIELETVPPREIDPLWKHWRGIVRASYEVLYI